MKHLGLDVTDKEERIHKFFEFPLYLAENDLIKNSSGNAFMKIEIPMNEDLKIFFLDVLNGESFVLRLSGLNFYCFHEIDTDYISMNGLHIMKFANTYGFQNIFKRMGHDLNLYQSTEIRDEFIKMIESRLFKLIERNNDY